MIATDADRLDGARLRALRRRKGWTQARLGAVAGVGERTVKRLESGSGGQPQPQTVAAIAGALGVDPDALFAGLRPAAAVEAGGEGPAGPRWMVGAELPFLGRSDEQASFLKWLEWARIGRGRALLIGGPPGVGKTRLAEQLADLARERGAEVSVGRAHEGGGAPAFWPWAQVVRQVRTRAGDARWRTELARLPALAAWMQVVDAGVSPDPGPGHGSAADGTAGVDPFALFDAIAQLLTRRAESAPQLIVLDDLHCADPASLRLLEFVIRQVGHLAAVVIATFRSTQAPAGSELARLLGAVAHEYHCRRLDLGPLTRDELGKLRDALGLRGLSAEGLDTIYARTDGHPFYLVHLLPEVLSSDAGGESARGAGAASLPRALCEAILHRVERLGPAGPTVLQYAALLGRAFAPAVVARAAGVSDEELFAVLAAACRADLVRVADESRPVRAATHAFVHALVAEVLAEGVRDRPRMHAQIATTLAGLCEVDAATWLPQIAHHALAAGTAFDPIQTVEWVRRAARLAAQSLAYEESVRLLDSALGVLESGVVVDPVTLCDVLLQLGEAQNVAGDGAGSAASYRRAADVARRLGDGRRFGVAALGVGLRFGQVFDVGLYDEAQIALLGEALDLVRESDAALRAKLLARLGSTLYWVGELSRCAAYSAEAVSAARRANDADAEVHAYLAAYLTQDHPMQPGERASAARAVRDIAHATGRRDHLIKSQVIAVAEAFYGARDAATIDRELERMAHLAERGNEPWAMWWLFAQRATRHLMAGRAPEGLWSARRAHELGKRAGTDMVDVTLATHTYGHDVLVGRGESLVANITAAVARYPANPAWRCLSLAMMLRGGATDAARHGFEQCVDEELHTLARPLVWSVCFALLAEICFELGDAERAKVLEDLLAPYASQNVIPGVGALFYGVMPRFCALLAATRGDDRAAKSWLGDALARARALGAEPHALQIELDAVRIDARLAPDTASGAGRQLEALADRARRAEWGGLLAEVERTRSELVTLVAGAPGRAAAGR